MREGEEGGGPGVQVEVPAKTLHGILRRGEFLLGPREGWGGTVGGFYGDATFQGILPYYYERVAPEGAHNEAELDRCVYNQMADNPRKSTYKFPRATPLDAEKMVRTEDARGSRPGRSTAFSSIPLFRSPFSQPRFS